MPRHYIDEAKQLEIDARQEIAELVRDQFQGQNPGYYVSQSDLPSNVNQDVRFQVALVNDVIEGLLKIGELELTLNGYRVATQSPQN